MVIRLLLHADIVASFQAPHLFFSILASVINRPISVKEKALRKITTYRFHLNDFRLNFLHALRYFTNIHLASTQIYTNLNSHGEDVCGLMSYVIINGIINDRLCIKYIVRLRYMTYCENKIFK